MTLAQAAQQYAKELTNGALPPYIVSVGHNDEHIVVCTTVKPPLIAPAAYRGYPIKYIVTGKIRPCG